MDFVQAGHGRLLENGGLLPPRFRLDGRRPVPYASRYEWLCIDVYISVGCVPISYLLLAPSSGLGGADLDAFDQALKIYDRVGLVGAANGEKDWRASLSWTAIGAEVHARLGGKGLRPCWGSLERPPLALLGLVARRPAAASCRSVGRCSCQQLDLHLLLTAPAHGRAGHLLWHGGCRRGRVVPRAVARTSELTLAAVLAPLAETNLAAQFDAQAFAMDTSPSHRAICHVPLPESVTRALWSTGERRGGYTRLETRARAALRGLGPLGRGWRRPLR